MWVQTQKQVDRLVLLKSFTEFLLLVSFEFRQRRREMEDLQNLEYLSVVSKICTELDNHLGVNDKDLAEFIVHMAQDSDSYDLFRRKLTEVDADFPDSFSSNLYRIVQKMLPTPAKKPTTTNENAMDDDDILIKGEQSRQLTDIALRKAMCPMLSKPNDPSVRVSDTY